MNTDARIHRDKLTCHIEKSIRNYPLIFHNRTDVLHHIFVVNGCGYEWVNGVAQPSYPESERDLSEILKDEEEELACALLWVDQLSIDDRNSAEVQKRIAIDTARTLCRVREYNTTMQFRRNNAHYLALVEKHKKSVYPLCEYALLANVPDDVDPIYLEAVRDVIFDIFATPVNMNFIPPYDEKARQENIQFASNVLTELAQRFGKENPDQPTSWEEYKAREASILEELFEGKAASKDNELEEAKEYIQEQSRIFEEHREQLLEQYSGKYVLFENGEVLDSGDSHEEVSIRAHRIGKTPIFIKQVMPIDPVYKTPASLP